MMTEYVLTTNIGGQSEAIFRELVKNYLKDANLYETVHRFITNVRLLSEYKPFKNKDITTDIVLSIDYDDSYDDDEPEIGLLIQVTDCENTYQRYMDNQVRCIEFPDINTILKHICAEAVFTHLLKYFGVEDCIKTGPKYSHGNLCDRYKYLSSEYDKYIRMEYVDSQVNLSYTKWLDMLEVRSKKDLTEFNNDLKDKFIYYDEYVHDKLVDPTIDINMSYTEWLAHKKYDV